MLNLKKRDLTKYDLIALIDVSGSTSTRDTASGQSRLEDCKKLTAVLIQEMEEIDDDGVTVHFFDNNHQVFENTTYSNVSSVLAKARPGGSTDTTGAVKRHIDDYFTKRFGTPAVAGSKGGFLGMGKKEAVPSVPGDPSTKPIIIVVVTDGVPNSESSLVRLIVDATKRLTAEGLNRDALGISFIQTGRDKNATRFLERLDDNLTEEGATMDIVNCLTIEDVEGLSTKQILERALDD